MVFFAPMLAGDREKGQLGVTLEKAVAELGAFLSSVEHPQPVMEAWWRGQRWWPWELLSWVTWEWRWNAGMTELWEKVEGVGIAQRMGLEVIAEKRMPLEKNAG